MEILKKLRDAASLTLRQVEEATNISNAYLSQLENGKIKKPSAQVLYVLAKLYSVDVETLLIESGLVKSIEVQPAVMKPSSAKEWKESELNKTFERMEKDFGRIDDLEKRVKALEFNHTNFI